MGAASASLCENAHGQADRAVNTNGLR